MTNEEECKCTKITGHLEAVKWIVWPRKYKPSPGYLSLADWTENPYIWLHYVESSDGLVADDDVLLSTDTQYWSIHDVQRYFTGGLHCEQVLFTCQYPNLRLPTSFGRHTWRINTAMKVPPNTYKKEINLSLEIELQRMELTETQIDRLIIPDQLIKIDHMNHLERKAFFRIILNILSFQDRLQLVSFENLCCKRLEGVRLIQQLACFNAETVKYLFLWRFVLPNENPVLINYTYITGSGQYIPRPDTRQCFIRSLAELRNLRILALEYSHIADRNGGALVSLLPVIKRPHFVLQLICREDQIPGRANAVHGTGGYGIPDTVWRRVTLACPDLYIHITFYRIRHYDDIRRFLTPSIPLREVHLEYGIDLKLTERQDSDSSCFFRHVAYYFAHCLVTLSIHQWRFAVFPLRRIFEVMPRLVRFSYVGKVQNETDIRNTLNIFACGVCANLKQFQILIQDDENTHEYWKQVTARIIEDYKDILNLYEIDFCMGIYKN